MTLSTLAEIMIIILLGMGSQWISWRFQMPAIVVMSVVGLLAGPIFGLIHPEDTFGDLFKPLISIAVAIILFEGSLSLSIKEIKGLGRPVIRIITVGALISWIFGSLAAHYVAGLGWAVSLVISALFIVTGPTVILPLLRQSKLKPRPSKILKWEGIIVDPLGALLAVLAFEVIVVLTNGTSDSSRLVDFFLGLLFAGFLGWACGRGVGWMFKKGYIPEFLKSPIVFAIVIGCFTISDEIKHETGLLAVTVMGMTLANIGIPSIQDMRHFKENISILLISVIFVMLTASLSMDTLFDIFQPGIIGFVVLMLFLVRPLSILLSTIRTDLTLGEKVLVGWIAPRGIVALTVSSYFASILLEEGYTDATIVTPLTFALVFFTVCAHGFTLEPLAKKLNLSIDDQPGILLVGSNAFTLSLGQFLQKLKVPFTIADSSLGKLEKVKKADLPFYHGEVLSEQTEHSIDMTPFEYLIAGTDYDSYNALVCSTFIPEYGRNNVFRLSVEEGEGETVKDLKPTIGGRVLFEEHYSLTKLSDAVENGFKFKRTPITKQYSYKQYNQDRSEKEIRLFVLKNTGALEFFTPDSDVKGEEGDIVISLSPPDEE
ncbi:cation:proton antiporter [Aquisalibacillus elongatus]|uniref:Sodium/proton antiporter (CPA1 family) n=1 Tax=Aquisalibacillus elongatus TaxID=485577 RepID=A0A3N5B1T0_9BACI|nr:sodium:proton antiporter [Aquisalibacillus elongatus]RPF51099.1 sodium/proton antiporter (CPA1 family) [Aquisalibacillus elongatus]